MTVYVANVDYGDEGERTLGVFSTEAAAIDAAYRHRNPQTGTHEPPLQRFEDDPEIDPEPYWADEQGGSTKYRIRPYEVK